MSHYQLETLEPRRLLSWGTVDDYQYLAGNNASAAALATDSSGQIHAVGEATTPTGQHLLVRKSSDQGTTWSAPMDDHIFPGSTGIEVTDIAVDGTGNQLFTTGFYYVASGSVWFVRRSQDAGLTWATVDAFTLGGSGAYAQARAVTMDAAGNVYVVGRATPGGIDHTWIVRRSLDGGSTWSTVDSITGRAEASGVFVHPTAGIFVAGAIVAASGISTSSGSSAAAKMAETPGRTLTTSNWIRSSSPMARDWARMPWGTSTLSGLPRSRIRGGL